MKKSYHSRDVPMRLATITRRTDEAWAVPSVWGIGISLGATRGRSSSSTAPTAPRGNRRRPRRDVPPAAGWGGGGVSARRPQAAASDDQLVQPDPAGPGHGQDQAEQAE